MIPPPSSPREFLPFLLPPSSFLLRGARSSFLLPPPSSLVGRSMGETTPEALAELSVLMRGSSTPTKPGGRAANRCVILRPRQVLFPLIRRVMFRARVEAPVGEASLWAPVEGERWARRALRARVLEARGPARPAPEQWPPQLVVACARTEARSRLAQAPPSRPRSRSTRWPPVRGSRAGPSRIYRTAL